MYVPCGRCAFCAATKRSDWATRLHYEAMCHDVKQFVTLTYADAHLVFKRGVSQLVKRHLQLWIKRIRKIGAKVRYYAVGEYGSRTYRPHYHVILFGDVSVDDIQRCWPHGHVHVGTVTQQSIMYTLGYLVSGKGSYSLTNRVHPFALMSRRPGLGYSYLSQDVIRWHRSGRKNYSQIGDEKRHLPRYYKEKIFSKLDLVRISVRDQKEHFNKMVAWIRAPEQMAMKDPLGYRQQQMRILHQVMLAKSKEGHII